MNITGSVIGRASGMLKLEGEGDKINITPIIESGTKIASVTINEGTPDEESIDLYAPEGFSGDYNDLSNKPDLFSGAYGDLTGKPYVNGQLLNGSIYTENYSTDEQIIGKWIDNSILYMKTIYVDNLSIGVNQSVNLLEISNINLKYSYGYINESTDTNTYIIPEIGCRIRYDGSHVILTATGGAAWNINDGAINIIYTKSS